MNRSRLLSAFVFFALLQDVSAAVVTKHVYGDAADSDFIVSCDSGPIAADYAAETASGVPPTDPYAVQRGADKGLISLMSQGGVRAKRYIIPHDLIRAIVRVQYDQVIPDRVDLVFTTKDLMLIHTSTGNAGVFTTSDVYQLAYDGTGRVDRKPLQQNEDLLQVLDLGLSFYRPLNAKCGF
jgi:hypothetical protein